MQSRFSHKTLLITGTSSDIGRAGARRLIQEGARLIITGRTASRLEATAAELGPNATAVLDDVSDGRSVERLLPLVERLGPLDGLWLNAAVAAGAPLESTDRKMIGEMLEINVVAPMLQMAALAPHLRPGASVLVTSSSAVYEGQPNVALYAASKAALLAAARSWAAELAPRRIRVNALVPGPITSNLRSVLPDELRSQFEEQLAEIVPLKRVGAAEEAAAVALFLLSDDASYVTGSAYGVDGGLLKR